MVMSPSQSVKLHDIKIDIVELQDRGILKLTTESELYVLDWIDKVLENDDGPSAWKFIGEWNTKTAIEAITTILKARQLIIK